MISYKPRNAAARAKLDESRRRKGWTCNTCVHNEGLGTACKKLCDGSITTDDYPCYYYKGPNRYRPKVYIISDGNGIEKTESWDQVVDIVASWYDCLYDEGRFENVTDIPEIDDAIYELEEGQSLTFLNLIIVAWENRIAEALGYSTFQGHGSFVVSPGSEMGLNLTVREEDL